MSQITQSYLLPFTQYAPAEVVNWYALNATGLAGQFVSLLTGAQDPSTSAGSYAGNISVGATYTNAVSLRYVNTRQVRPSAAGDTKYNVVGVTLHTTAEYDENGNKLILMPPAQTIERGFVVSGQSVPVLMRGIVTIKNSQVSGVPIPGYVGVVSLNGNGTIDVVNPNTASVALSLLTGAGSYTGTQILGRFLSSSGSAFGGYSQFHVEL